MLMDQCEPRRCAARDTRTKKFQSGRYARPEGPSNTLWQRSNRASGSIRDYRRAPKMRTPRDCQSCGTSVSAMNAPCARSPGFVVATTDGS
jgi:hypothetical protein